LWMSECIERELVTGNETPRVVAQRCIIEASIGQTIKHNIVEALEATTAHQTRGNLVQAIGAT
jgi:hypothetical protein